MKIVNGSNFTVSIVGKCTNKTDILQLFNFGFSKEGIVKKYKKDNKLQDREARNIVEKTILESRG